MSASESVSAQHAALAVEALRSAGYLRLRVRGESMLPTLWPGDIAAIETCALSNVNPGEIVLVFSRDRLFLHRLVAKHGGGFFARGDSMPDCDPLYESEALIGRLVGTIRFDKRLPGRLPLHHWSRALGLLFCYTGMARRVALKLHQRQTLGARRAPVHAVDLNSSLCAGEMR